MSSDKHAEGDQHSITGITATMSPEGDGKVAIDTADSMHILTRDQARDIARLLFEAANDAKFQEVKES